MDEYKAFILAEFHFSNTDIDWGVCFAEGDSWGFLNNYVDSVFDSSDCWLAEDYQ